MEDQGLTAAPPPLLENAIACTLPPCAREIVLGDLREIYRTPAQYAGEALRTVPLVILSTAWRSVNLPLLLLQGGLIFAALRGLQAIMPFGTLDCLALTGLTLLTLVIRDTWRRPTRPAASNAVRQAILAGVFLLLFCPAAFGLRDAHPGIADALLQFQLLTVLPLAVPLFGLLRSWLIVGGDHVLDEFADRAAGHDLRPDYHAFLLRLRRRHLTEAGALLGAGLGLAAFWRWDWLAALYAVAALFLFIHGMRAPVPPNDVQALSADYRRLLNQEKMLRGFLWWLWASPLLALSYQSLLQAGFAAHRTLLVAAGSAITILIVFLVSALNQECTGRAGEQIRLLERRPR